MTKLVAKVPDLSKSILVVVAPGFSYLTLGCIIEPLSYAQSLGPFGNTRISVHDLGQLPEKDGLRLAGTGTLSDLEASLSGTPSATAIFFCCGFDVPAEARAPLRRLMRLARRNGVPIYGMGSATWALAELGMLPNRTGAVHWSSLSAFRERNLQIDPSAKLFVADTKVTTCAGELATLDLIIHFVSTEFGRSVADQVCDRFLVYRPRGPESEQPQQTASLLRYAPQVVRATAERMRETLEQPLRIDELAAEVGLSQRQLERHFTRYLGAPPRRYYLQLQLGLAWQLCEQTDLPLSEIALASGFGSSSSLSRKFKYWYSISPSELRSR